MGRDFDQANARGEASFECGDESLVRLRVVERSAGRAGYGETLRRQHHRGWALRRVDTLGEQNPYCVHLIAVDSYERSFRIVVVGCAASQGLGDHMPRPMCREIGRRGHDRPSICPVRAAAITRGLDGA